MGGWGFEWWLLVHTAWYKKMYILCVHVCVCMRVTDRNKEGGRSPQPESVAPSPTPHHRRPEKWRGKRERGSWMLIENMREREREIQRKTPCFLIRLNSITSILTSLVGLKITMTKHQMRLKHVWHKVFSLWAPSKNNSWGIALSNRHN